MKVTEQRLNPEEYVLAILSPQEKLEAALQLAREAFKGTSLTLVDVEAAVRKVRRRLYAQRQSYEASDVSPCWVQTEVRS